MFINQSTKCKQGNGVYLNFTQIFAQCKENKNTTEVYKHFNLNVGKNS